MQSEPRVTRSRAKALNTPLTAALPYGGTTSKKGAKPQDNQKVELPRKALFDLPNARVEESVVPTTPAETKAQQKDKVDTKEIEIEVKTSQGDSFTPARVPQPTPIAPQSQQTPIAPQARQPQSETPSVTNTEPQTPAGGSQSVLPECPETQQLPSITAQAPTATPVQNTPQQFSPQQPVSVLVDRIENRVATPCSVAPPGAWGFLKPGQTPLIPRHGLQKTPAPLLSTPLPHGPGKTGFGSPILPEDTPVTLPADSPSPCETHPEPKSVPTPATLPVLAELPTIQPSPLAKTNQTPTPAQASGSKATHLNTPVAEQLPESHDVAQPGASPNLQVDAHQGCPGSPVLETATVVSLEDVNSNTPDSMRAEIGSLSSPLLDTSVSGLSPLKLLDTLTEAPASTAVQIAVQDPVTEATIETSAPVTLQNAFDIVKSPQYASPVVIVKQEEVLAIKVEPSEMAEDTDSNVERLDIEMADSTGSLSGDEQEEEEQENTEHIHSLLRVVPDPFQADPDQSQDPGSQEEARAEVVHRPNPERQLDKQARQAASSSQTFDQRVAKLDAIHAQQVEKGAFDRWAMDGEVQSPAIQKVKPAQKAKSSKLSSQVNSSSYDPRSLRQLKKEVKTKLQAKPAVPGLKSSPTHSAASSIYTDVHRPPQGKTEEEEEVTSLTQAVQGMRIATHSPEPLKGVPVPQGKHTRFDDEGNAVEIQDRTLLRGVPKARGTHIRFD